MTKLKSLEKKIAELPPGSIHELELYIDSLLRKARKDSKRKLKKDWSGGLKEWRSKFTAVELQKRGLEWRSK
jgi:hypothetical protein